MDTSSLVHLSGASCDRTSAATTRRGPGSTDPPMATAPPNSLCQLVGVDCIVSSEAGVASG
jgi:hypothetical protein